MTGALRVVRQRLGKYQILNRIGGGSQADVYRAFDTVLESEVALKIFRGSASREGDFVAELRKEASISRQLLHPNIVTTYDFSVEDDIAFMVMEYLDGNLADQLSQPQGLTMERGVEIVLNIARALEYAHSHHIIHRDVKPLNILIGQNSAPKLGDFGIARAGTFSSSATRTLGTPAYMAPEQWEGIADSRSDIYSLGILLYEILTGSPPHRGPDMSSFMTQHQREPVPPFPRNLKVPNDLKDIAFGCLEKSRDQRYQYISDVVQALEAWLEPTPEPGPPETSQLETSGSKISDQSLLGHSALDDQRITPPELVAATTMLDTQIASNIQGVTDLSPNIVFRFESFPTSMSRVNYLWMLGIDLALFVFGLLTILSLSSYANDFEPSLAHATGLISLTVGVILLILVIYEFPGIPAKQLTLWHKINALLSNEEYTSAVNELSVLISMESKNMWAYYNRGYCYQMLNQYALAIDDYTKALMTNPWSINNIYNINSVGRLQTYALNNRACLHENSGLPRRALSDYTAARNVSINLRSYSIIEYNLGNYRYRYGHYQNALNHYKTALTKSFTSRIISGVLIPHFDLPGYRLLHNSAITYAQLGQYRQAKLHLESALKRQLPANVADEYRKAILLFDNLAQRI